MGFRAMETHTGSPATSLQKCLPDIVAHRITEIPLHFIQINWPQEYKRRVVCIRIIKILQAFDGMEDGIARAAVLLLIPRKQIRHLPAFLVQKHKQVDEVSPCTTCGNGIHFHHSSILEVSEAGMDGSSFFMHGFLGSKE